MVDYEFVSGIAISGFPLYRTRILRNADTSFHTMSISDTKPRSEVCIWTPVTTGSSLSRTRCPANIFYGLQHSGVTPFVPIGGSFQLSYF